MPARIVKGGEGRGGALLVGGAYGKGRGMPPPRGMRGAAGAGRRVRGGASARVSCEGRQVPPGRRSASSPHSFALDGRPHLPRGMVLRYPHASLSLKVVFNRGTGGSLPSPGPGPQAGCSRGCPLLSGLRQGLPSPEGNRARRETRASNLVSTA